MPYIYIYMSYVWGGTETQRGLQLTIDNRVVIPSILNPLMTSWTFHKISMEALLSTDECEGSVCHD